MTSTNTCSTLLPTGSEPAFIYGTAWKKDQTSRLVKEALAAGFRGVDTAAQPRHYREDLVGVGLREALREGTAQRSDIYLQTKFTSPRGQDANNMPYDPEDGLETQIHTSVSSSLHNLRHSEDQNADNESYIDCLLLHSPYPTSQATLEAWKILESYVPHKILRLGISNVSLGILEELYERSSVKPSVVQNRFYPSTYYDVQLRKFCVERGIMYQSFWTLTGNPRLLASEAIEKLANAAKVSSASALYSLVMNLGIVVLNGTTSTQHMQDDLAEIKEVQKWATSYPDDWKTIAESFASLIE
ncbi:aldo-keto reductase-like protein [Glonium stellatum]|uniref:Aldo-keto reductase-like protein n=1 Tax=Glonium stellatum TaxID=574774 RepID=A0A8E2EVZ9_9PEZI|nr:aldo-keto reductase-like protein [Glonium stellatum]